jgi:ferredoxin-NADP reductase
VNAVIRPRWKEAGTAVTMSSVSALPVTSTRSASDFEADLVVVARRDEAPGVVVVDFAHPTGDLLPGWTPGAHIDVHLPGGLVRQYSLCGTPADRGRWSIGVLHEPQGRGGSRWIFGELMEGSSLRVRGPRNNFPLQPADRYVFVAGGIGITPLLPMIQTVHAAGLAWELHYGGRSRSSMAFLAQLAKYGPRVRVYPQDEVGLLNLEAVLDTTPDDALVYCCGPSPLIAALEDRCRTRRPGTLHVERFTAALDPAGQPANTRFDVVCQRSGTTVSVPPELSILEAVENAGVTVLSSCAEGICGTCETRVLHGAPDHRDSLLTDEEKAAGDSMMICVSRCRGDRLVLDL